MKKLTLMLATVSLVGLVQAAYESKRPEPAKSGVL